MLELPAAEPLLQLAEATGSQLLLFDPAQGLNALASQILSERTQYKLTYTSHANTPGSHQVQIRITGDQIGDQDFLICFQSFVNDSFNSTHGSA